MCVISITTTSLFVLESIFKFLNVFNVKNHAVWVTIFTSIPRVPTILPWCLFEQKSKEKVSEIESHVVENIRLGI